MRTLPDSVPTERIRSQPRSENGMLSEMQGYEEIGMRREALRIARKILRRRMVTAEEFQEAVFILLTIQSRIKQSVGMVECAYQRLSTADRKRVRRVMLSFYCSVGDHSKALAQATLRPKDAVSGGVKMS